MTSCENLLSLMKRCSTLSMWASVTVLNSPSEMMWSLVVNCSRAESCVNLHSALCQPTSLEFCKDPHSPSIETVPWLLAPSVTLALSAMQTGITCSAANAQDPRASHPPFEYYSDYIAPSALCETSPANIPPFSAKLLYLINYQCAPSFPCPSHLPSFQLPLNHNTIIHVAPQQPSAHPVRRRCPLPRYFVPSSFLFQYRTSDCLNCRNASCLPWFCDETRSSSAFSSFVP